MTMHGSYEVNQGPRTLTPNNFGGYGNFYTPSNDSGGQILNSINYSQLLAAGREQPAGFVAAAYQQGLGEIPLGLSPPPASTSNVSTAAQIITSSHSITAAADIVLSTRSSVANIFKQTASNSVALRHHSGDASRVLTGTTAVPSPAMHARATCGSPALHQHHSGYNALPMNKDLMCSPTTSSAVHAAPFGVTLSNQTTSHYSPFYPWMTPKSTGMYLVTLELPYE